MAKRRTDKRWLQRPHLCDDRLNTGERVRWYSAAGSGIDWFNADQSVRQVTVAGSPFILVLDARAGAGRDALTLVAHRDDVRSTTIDLRDSSGAAFDSYAIPHTLAYQDFDYRQFWSRYIATDGATYDVSGEFIALASVPEPSEWALLAAGVPLLAWRARRRPCGSA